MGAAAGTAAGAAAGCCRCWLLGRQERAEYSGTRGQRLGAGRWTINTMDATNAEPLMDDLAFIQSLVASHSEPRGSSSDDDGSDDAGSGSSSSSDSSDTDSTSSDEEGGEHVAPPVDGADDELRAVEDCLAALVTHVARAAEGLGSLSDSRCVFIASARSAHRPSGAASTLALAAAHQRRRRCASSLAHDPGG